MSLRTKLGGIFIYLSVMYIFIIPFVNPASLHAYVPEFITLGAAGIVFLYFGRNDKPSKSP